MGYHVQFLDDEQYVSILRICFLLECVYYINMEYMIIWLKVEDCNVYSITSTYKFVISNDETICVIIIKTKIMQSILLKVRKM